jgi:hypothetical protein
VVRVERQGMSRRDKHPDSGAINLLLFVSLRPWLGYAIKILEET